MNRPLAWRLVRTAVSAAVPLLVTDLAARAETFPASPFNGMQITYSLSGASVDKQEDGEGFTVSRRLSGKLGDGTLRVSGTAGMGNGYSADLVVTVSAGGKQGEFKLNIPTGWPGMNTKPFDVAVPIPDDALSGSVSVSMTGNYNAGSRGLVVSGEFSREAKPKGVSSGIFSGWLPGGESPKATPKPARELPVRGTLTVTQELSPPRRIVSFDVRRPIESVAGQGTAIHRLVLGVGGLPAEAAAAVVASFEIDSPSRITGPARRLRLDGGQAVTTFVFHPSEAEGQGGVVFARARFPVSVKEEDGEWTASERTQLAVARIRPICDRGASIYYNDDLVSDVTYDLTDLERELGGAVARYGQERISATPYTSAGLGWFLAHPGGKAMGLSLEYYSGQEIQLHRHVIAEGRKKPLTPGELFGKALELNGGDMTKALLTCHNVLRAASGRGGEAFPRTGLTEEERALLERKGLTREEMAKRQEVMLSTGEFSDGRIWDSLVSLRPGVDNKGAWYHLMGTATMSLAVQSNFVADNAVQLPSGQRAGLEGVIWAEEYLQSGDIYSDPNEYCVDAQGLLLGDFLRSQLTGARRDSLKDQLSERLKRLGQAAGMGGQDRRVAVEVRCPVSTTLTDPVSGRYFRLDQKTGEVEGDLALGFGLVPEGEFFGLVAVVPRSDVALRVEPVAPGRFSIRTWDPALGRATAFEDVAAAPGEVWALDTSAGGEEPTLREASGAERPGKTREVEAAAVERVRAAATSEAIARGGFSTDPRTGALRDLSAAPVGPARPERAAKSPSRRWAVVIALGAFAGLAATFGLAALVMLARRGVPPGGAERPLIQGLEVDGPGGPTFVALAPGSLAIGRREDNDLVIADPEVSGSHAEIDVLDGQVVLRDLSSRNGTRLNGQPIRSAAVGPGDRITVGATVIVVR